MFGFAEPIEGFAARDGRDAPRAGRDAFLADDVEQADLARVADVRAAAKLLAELAHRHHPHDVGIFFAEQHHRPGLAGFGDRQLSSNRPARPTRHLLVHFAFDLLDQLRADGRRIGEVEPQPIVVHLRALLQGMRAEMLLQGVMQDVRGRMGAADAGAAGGVDLGGQLRRPAAAGRSADGRRAA